jgi:hypothetical protein
MANDIAPGAIGAALSFDPFDAAQRISGESYKTSPDTEMLGVALHLLNGERKREMLRESGDTHWGQSMPEWIATVEGLGFRQVFCMDVPDSEDKYRIWWREDGLLLHADSYYSGESVNSAKVYFHFRGPRNAMQRCSNGFAGEQDGQQVWAGDYDAREGLRYALERMESMGEFVNPWLKRPFLWLLHYQDAKVEGYDFRAITEARIRQLPDFVQRCIPA